MVHTHLMSLSLVFLCLGVIFSFCGVGQTMKAWFMPMPFAAPVVDFGARALIPYAPSLVYVMMGAGALMGLSMLVLTAGPLYEMWVRSDAQPEGQGRAVKKLMRLSGVELQQSPETLTAPHRTRHSPFTDLTLRRGVKAVKR